MAEIVSTAVITGRRINGSDRFMDLRSHYFALLCARWRTRRCAPCRSSAGGIHTHLAVRSYGHLAGHDDVFSRGDTLSNHHVIALPLAQGHESKVRGVIGFHHVDEGTLLADLCGLVGDQHRPL